MKFIKLQDGTTLEIKVNMLTLNMIAKGKHNLSDASKTEDSNEQIEMMSTMIYALMYSNGRKISKEDALALVPIDETDTFFELISGFQEEVEKFQKKKPREVESVEDNEIDWARCLYIAHAMGLSEDEFWNSDPITFYKMVDYHNEIERSKYGKK